MPVISFTKVDLPYGWLGNMAPYPITYNGQLWRTSEALFQALRFDDHKIREIIRAEKSPMGAKMKAKKYRAQMVIEPMSDADLNNMKLCLKLKFQNEDLRRRLLSTGNYTIYEDIGKRNGERHFFWGAKSQRNNNNEVIWEGKNMMGKLLMELRAELLKS